MVRLEPMTEEEFDGYLRYSNEEYAKEKVRAGTWKEEEALRLSEESFQSLLPDGLATPKALLYRIVDGESGEKVGHYWLHEMDSPAGKTLYIYDFLIETPFQGQGYGKAAMAALDVKAKELGAAQLSLHVFGHNTRAFRLYEKSGFHVTDYMMSKPLA